MPPKTPRTPRRTPRPRSSAARACDRAAPGAHRTDRLEGDGSDNRTLAEWLSRAAAGADGHLQRAYRRAARAAFLWPEEARDLRDAGRSLTELRAIGPYLERVLAAWLDEPPERPEPPPLRRGFLTMARARRVLRERALAVNGDLQSHTTWSDGRAGPEEMALAAHGRGLAFLAVTDHTHGLRIACGMTEEEMAAQTRQLEALAPALPAGFTLLRGVEANLDPSGRLDVSAASVAGHDLVLGAFHSALRRTEDQTERYLAALRHPLVDVLAHPRCRVYDHRLGLSADWPRVFAEAARQGKAVEVDAHPDRQDLDVALLSLARAEGCFVSLGTDAHRPEELGSLDLGAAAAVLAGVAEDRLLNAWSADRIRAWAAARRAR